MDIEKKSNGAVIGLTIIIIILVVGGLYMWMSNTNPDELNTLEADIQATDTNTGVDVNTVE